MTVTEEINAILAEGWGPIRQLFLDQGAEELSGFAKPGGTFQITDPFLSVASGLDSPPGVTQLVTTQVDGREQRQVGLALPIQTDGWSFDLTGYLTANLTPQLQVHAKPFLLRASKLRIEVDAVCTFEDANDPDRLVLTSLTPALTLDLEIPGFLTIRADTESGFKLAGKPAPSSELFRFVAETTVDLSYLGGQGTASATVTLDPFGTSSIHLDKIVAQIGLTIPFPLPDWIKQTFAGIAANEIPMRWGEDPPALPAGMPPVTQHLLFQEAQRIGQDIKAHVPFGTSFDLKHAFDAHKQTYTLENYVSERDSAIWSGHHLAAEAFHFAAAGELVDEATAHGDAAHTALFKQEQSVAWQNANLALSGIEKLFLVPQLATGSDPAGANGTPDPIFPFYLTNFTGLLCRAVLPATDLDKTCPKMDGSDTVNNIPPPCYSGTMTAASMLQTYYTDPVTIDGQPWYGFGRDHDAAPRDSSLGILWGLATVWRLIPDFDGQTSSLKQRAGDLLTRMLRFLLANNWAMPSPSGVLDRTAPFKRGYLIHFFTTYFHMQLALLRLGKSVNPAEFGAQYDRCAQVLPSIAWLPVWVDTFDPVDPDHYYKFNLSHAAFGILSLLEEDAELRKTYRDTFRLLRRAVHHHHNAYFDLMWVLAQEPADRPQTLQDLIVPPADLLQQWLTRRDLVCRKAKGPGPGGSRAVSSLPTQAEPAPTYLPKLYNVPAAQRCAAEYTFFGSSKVVVSKAPLPLHIRPGIFMDFLWQRGPFTTRLGLHGDTARLDSTGDASIEVPGTDYLLAYWMAVYLKAFDPDAEPIPAKPEKVEPAEAATADTDAPDEDPADATDAPSTDTDSDPSVASPVDPSPSDPSPSDPSLVAPPAGSLLTRIGGVQPVLNYDLSLLSKLFSALETLQGIAHTINSNTEPFGRGFATQSLYEILAQDRPTEEIEQAKATFLANARNQGIPLESSEIDDLNQTFLQLIALTTVLDPVEILAGFFKYAAGIFNLTRTAEIDAISDDDLQTVVVSRLFSADNLAAIRDYLAQGPLHPFGLPWEPFLTDGTRDIGTEIRAYLGILPVQEAGGVTG